MEVYYREALVQKSIPILLQKKVYLAKLDRMANAELQYDDAICLCLTILKELGCKFPGGRLMGLMKAVVSAHMTVKMLKQTPMEVLDSLHVVTDLSKLVLMSFLTRLVDLTFLG
eukprot:6184398-Ditylum_brightwellii.AAC.1